MIVTNCFLLCHNTKTVVILMFGDYARSVDFKFTAEGGRGGGGVYVCLCVCLCVN